jgi:hypothetical protein
MCLDLLLRYSISININGLVSLTGVRASTAVFCALLFTLMIAAFVGAPVHAAEALEPVERGVVAPHLSPLSLTKVSRRSMWPLAT